MGEWKDNVGRAASPFAAARGIGLNSRFSPQSFLAFATGRFGGSEFWRGADFAAQQKMLPCATNNAALRNKGMDGCARRLMRCRKLQGKKCAPFITLLAIVGEISIAEFCDS